MQGPALVSAVLCNINRDPKKKPQPFVPEDFIGKAKPADPQAEMRAKLSRIRDGMRRNKSVADARKPKS